MWNETEERYETMQSIIALLFSLACLANRVAEAPDATRGYVLCLLRAATACGCDAVMGFEIDRKNYAPEYFDTGDDSPEAAIGLAQTLCVLAVLHHYVLGRFRISRDDLRIVPGRRPIVPFSRTILPSAGGGGCAIPVYEPLDGRV